MHEVADANVVAVFSKTYANQKNKNLSFFLSLSLPAFLQLENLKSDFFWQSINAVLTGWRSEPCGLRQSSIGSQHKVWRDDYEAPVVPPCDRGGEGGLDGLLALMPV